MTADALSSAPATSIGRPVAMTAAPRVPGRPMRSADLFQVRRIGTIRARTYGSATLGNFADPLEEAGCLHPAREAERRGDVPEDARLSGRAGPTERSFAAGHWKTSRKPSGQRRQPTPPLKALVDTMAEECRNGGYARVTMRGLRDLDDAGHRELPRASRGASVLALRGIAGSLSRVTRSDCPLCLPR